MSSNITKLLMWGAGPRKVLKRFSRYPTAWLTRIAQLHPDACQARTWHAHKLVCLKKPQGGHRPILISSVWIKLISRLLLKEAGAPLKELVQNVQFGVGIPHGGLALLTKVRSHLHKNPRHALSSWKSTSIHRSHMVSCNQKSLESQCDNPTCPGRGCLPNS